MAHALDLDAYFARIGFRDRPAADLATLRRLHALHPAAIPFENLSPLLHLPVPIDLPALEAKLIWSRRGGYCFEQNTLFEAVLRQLGFTVTSHAARVLWNAPEGVARPRSHMLLRVALPEATYIADVGFGGVVLMAPLRFEPDVEQATPHEPHRLVRIGEEYELQVRFPERWAPLYQFSLQEQMPVDWEVANWFTATHPESIFRKNLMAARATEDRRYGLRDNALRIRRSDGTQELRTLTTAGELAAVLKDTFGIDVPKGSRAALERVAATRA